MKCIDYNLQPCSYCVGEVSPFGFECWLDEIDNMIIGETDHNHYVVNKIPMGMTRSQWFMIWIKNPWVHDFATTRQYIMTVMRIKYPELEKLMVLL